MFMPMLTINLCKKEEINMTLEQATQHLANCEQDIQNSYSYLLSNADGANLQIDETLKSSTTKKTLIRVIVTAIVVFVIFSIFPSPVLLVIAIIIACIWSGGIISDYKKAEKKLRLEFENLINTVRNSRQI